MGIYEERRNLEEEYISLRIREKDMYEKRACNIINDSELKNSLDSIEERIGQIRSMLKMLKGVK